MEGIDLPKKMWRIMRKVRKWMLGCQWQTFAPVSLGGSLETGKIHCGGEGLSVDGDTEEGAALEGEELVQKLCASLSHNSLQ